MARHCSLPDGPQASFNSSNQELDAVWDLCARSALYTTHEQFVDTPTREKGQFLWDACSESQVIMRVHGESNLSFQALRDFARSQKRFWPDGRVSDIYPTGYGAQSYVNFTALYPEWVWRYFLSTGDLASMKIVVSDPRTPRRLPVAAGRQPDRARHRASRSRRAPTATTGTTSTPSATPRSTSCPLTHLLASRSSRTPSATAEAPTPNGPDRPRVTEAVNRYLVRPDGIYVDGLRSDGTRSPHSSQLANIQALAYGLVPPERRVSGGPVRREPRHLGRARAAGWSFCGPCTLQGSTQTSSRH